MPAVVPTNLYPINFSMEGEIFTSTGINKEKLWLHYIFLPVWDTLTPLVDQQLAVEIGKKLSGRRIQRSPDVGDIGVNMKSLIFFFIFILCTACVPQTLPAVEPSPTLIASQPSLATTRPASTSFSGSTTTPTLLPPSPTPIFEVLIDNLAIGQQGQLYASGFGVYGDDLRHYAHWDGAKWIALGTGFKTAGNSLVIDSAGHLYTEALIDSRQDMSTAIMRWDGVSWEDITGNFGIVVDSLKAGRVSGNIPVTALAVDGEDNLYAAGWYYYPSTDHTDEWSMGYVAKWNKETWIVLGQGFDTVNVFALAVSATGDLYVSGEQPITPEGNSSYIAQWDGEKWTQINTSKLKNVSLSIALDTSRRLYASGQQWSAPGELIVYRDGADWITINDQMAGEAPAVFDMAVDAKGHLYIGGSFESVSGIPARNIAYWDGSLWRALGEGVNERVYALAFDPSGELYVVGLFTEAGGLPAPHLARWDGEIWHALGQ